MIVSLGTQLKEAPSFTSVFLTNVYLMNIAGLCYLKDNKSTETRNIESVFFDINISDFGTISNYFFNNDSNIYEITDLKITYSATDFYVKMNLTCERFV